MKGLVQNLQGLFEGRAGAGDAVAFVTNASPVFSTGQGRITVEAKAGFGAADVVRMVRLPQEGALIMSVKTHRPRPSTSGSSGRPVVADGADRRRATSWTVVAALLALAASVLGLLLDGVYGGEASTAAMLRAYDLVTAVLVAPGLLVSTWLSRNRPGRAQLVVVGLVAYLVYTYAYYLFGTGFSDLFLLHAAAMSAAALALVLQLTSLDVGALAGEALTRRRARGAAVVLGVLAVALGGLWVYFAVHNAVTGRVPAGSRLVESDTVVHLGMALDLVFLVPLYAASALLLWRGSPWGHVLGAVSVVAGVLHQVSYLVAMPVQVAAEVPGAVSYDAAEPVIVALYLLGAALLFGQPTRRTRTGLGRTR